MLRGLFLCYFSYTSRNTTSKAIALFRKDKPMRLSAEERAVLERHKVDPEIVRELEEARNARELNKSVVRDIKTSLHSLADESFKDMPVVSIISGRNGFALKSGEVRNHLDAKDRTPVDRIKKWRVFGDIAASSNLDITDAERADIAKKKAERNGLLL